MSENTKTLLFVAIGMLAVGIGLFTRPTVAKLDEESLVGTDLTKHFTSVDDAKKLRIVRFDEDTATRQEFEVAENDGLWTIPSKDGYPADAARQMAEAATSLMDRKILQVASSNTADHEQFGVIDPSSPKLEAGQKGVGTRVTMYDEKQEPLVDLIVGKAVKDADGQRYVREAGRNLVYAIEIDRSKLSTNFEDWIEKDLLKLNAWDLKQVDLKDYSAALVQVMTDQGPSIGINRDDRADLIVDYDEAAGKWTPEKLKTFDGTKGERGEYVDFTLAADEELNEEALNGLKTALDDLQIVDVVRKPQGMSKDLKAGADFIKDREVFLDLASKGFTATGIGDGAPQDIISSDGEVIATMKNGAEYVLRFGNLTNVTGIDKPEDAAVAENPTAAKSDDDLHRYMFVMARFNDKAIKEPEYKPLPELPEETPAAAADTATTGDAAAQTTTPSETPATAPDDQPEAEASTTPEAAPAESAKPEAASASAEAATAKPAETPAPQTEQDKERERILAERKQIEQENKRLKDEYDEAVKKGQEAVKELNLRFGDWYFVVDDAVFKKIRLGREDVIKKKAPATAEGEAPAESAIPVSPTGAPAGLPEIPGAAQ